MKAAVWLESDFLPGFQERHWRRLEAEVPEVEFLPCRDQTAFLALLPHVDIAVTWRFRAEWLDSAPRVRLIATPAAGHDWIQALPRPGLQLAFGAFHGELMAETTLGLILSFSRGIHESWLLRNQTWPRAEVTASMRTVRGSRALILGFGNIGKWIGRMLAPLGVKIWGINRSDLSRPEYFDKADDVFSITKLPGLLPHVDHLILALPGGKDTDRIMNEDMLALLPPHAFIYNVGRGNSIDDVALAKALEDGRLAGAGLDVYPHEPLPVDSPLRNCPNAILMPHVSAFSPNYHDLYLNELVPLARQTAQYDSNQ